MGNKKRIVVGFALMILGLCLFFVGPEALGWVTIELSNIARGVIVIGGFIFFAGLVIEFRPKQR